MIKQQPKYSNRMRGRETSRRNTLCYEIYIALDLDLCRPAALLETDVEKYEVRFHTGIWVDL